MNEPDVLALALCDLHGDPKAQQRLLKAHGDDLVAKEITRREVAKWTGEEEEEPVS